MFMLFDINMTPNDEELGKGKEEYLSKHHSPDYCTDTYRQEMEKLEKNANCFSKLLNYAEKFLNL